MIKDVSFEENYLCCLPHKFEAGTPNIAGVVAFKAAIDFIKNRIDKIAKYEENYYNMQHMKFLK